MFTRVPTFSADQSDALNTLSDRIAKDVLAKGRTAASDLADKLEAARHAYLKSGSSQRGGTRIHRERGHGRLTVGVTIETGDAVVKRPRRA